MRETAEQLKAAPTVSENLPEPLTRVLVVEDSKGLNRIIQKALLREGFLVEQAFDGETALALAAQYPDSIMLLDFVLPDMTAPQVIERLREQGGDVPFIMMTGQGDERVAVSMMKLGARDYITKQGNFLETLPRILRRVRDEVEQHQRVLQAERSQRESERRFREVLENVNLIALMFDVEGKITFCNECFFKLTGWKHEDIVGQSWFGPVLPDDIRARVQEIFSLALQGEDTTHCDEYDILTKEGERRTISWRRILLRDASGAIVGVNSLGEDITERKQTDMRQSLTAQILSWLNSSEEQTGIIHKILLALKDFSGVESVGIRLQDREDYPYYATNGFADDFLARENSLCVYDEDGVLVRDQAGQVLLDCICGTVIRGNTNASRPFFTRGGSFWVNEPERFLQNLRPEDRHFCTRCHCVESGYRSIALIPLRAGESIIGLLQLNDRRPNAFSRHSIRFFEEIGASIGIAITRKQTEEQLLQLKKAVETMHLGVTISDLDRKIVYTNPADAAMHGYIEEELLGRSAAIFAPAELQHCLSLEEVEQSRNWIRESLNIRKDGSSFPVQLSSDIVRDADNHPIAIVTTCEDISERKQAEERITQERNLLRTLIDNLPDFIFVKDLEGRFLINNRAHAAFFGAADVDELIGTQSDEYIGGDMLLVDWETDCAVLQDGVPLLNQETLCSDPDGHSEWRSITKVPLRDAEQQIVGLVGISRDINEQKLAQKALESQTMELEERVKELNCLFQLSHLTEREELEIGDILEQAVNLLPPAWKFPDLACARIRVWDQEFRTQNFVETSWKLESLIEEESRALGVVQVYYTAECPEAYEGPFLQEERSLLNIIAERLGELIARKKAEEAILESQQFLQSTLDSLSAHIAILDERGTIVEVNASWKSFADRNGVQGKYFVGQNYLSVCENPSAKEVGGGAEAAAGIREVIKGTQATFYQEYPCHGPDERRWFAMRVTRFQSHDSRRIVIAHENISERKLAEEALQKTLSELESRVQERTAELVLLNEELERASRLKDEFLANMSHELRTPLNAVLGYAQILQNADNLTQQQQEALVTVKNSGEHLLSMINEILDLAKIESGHITLETTAFHLPNFLKGIADMLRVRARQKGIEFLYLPGDELPEGVLLDEKRLREVLLNLLGNAVKFTRRGRVSFRVTASSVHDVPHETAESLSLATILFEIEDSGPGIAPEHLSDIFLPFRQIDKQQQGVQGTGLGLTISRKLVSIMGSDIQVNSEPGRGSRFWFAIDAREVEGLSQDDRSATAKILGYAGAVRSVLIVDDSFENRAILRTMLQPLGFKVLEAANGEDGIALARSASPDAILLDLLMPGIDGFEAARRIRREQSLEQTPMIAVSAGAFETIRRQSLEAGCDDFLTKPFTIESLLDLLQQYLQLEWSYDEPEPRARPEMSLPDLKTSLWTFIPETVRRELLACAVRGNVKELLKQIEELETQETIPDEALRSLWGMAKRFEVDRIVEFLQATDTAREEVSS